MKYNPEGILNLRNAIVERVAKDYINERMYLKKHPNSKDHKTELELIIRWFKSSKFEDMETGLSGDYILKMLDEMIENDTKPSRHRVGKTHDGKKKS